MSDLNGDPTEFSITRSHPIDELSAHDCSDKFLTPPIDGDRLLERCMGNLNSARTLLDEFEATSRSCLDVLDAGLAESNYAAISAKAHSLKGVAGILIANTLKDLSSKLESAAKDADGNRTRDLIQQLRHEIQRTLDFIPSIRKF